MCVEDETESVCQGQTMCVEDETESVWVRPCV